MTNGLDYLKCELEHLKQEFCQQKMEIEKRIEDEVNNFIKKHGLKKSDPTHTSIINEYKDLKMRIYARDLAPKEELLATVKNKIEQMEKIFP